MDDALLWEKFTKTKDPKIKEQLIIKYMPLVKLVAGRMAIYFGGNVEYDDLVSYGSIGLLDAIEKFDSQKGVKFETYAYTRIKGAIIDCVRSQDFLPRSIRQKAKEIERVYIEIEKEGKTPTNQEVAKRIGISVEELQKLQDRISSGMIISLESFLEQNYESKIGGLEDFVSQPEHFIENEELREVLRQQIDNLLENERMVIVLYYYEELSIKEIAKVLGVSESRVSQLHTRALLKLRSALQKYLEK
ncbi:RNA polymerase sigma factor for flagellar operon FliA [Caldicellulosiruptor bescii]|uniref:RNA polymerase sigma factor n=2 Tax=Caldicellulosiruptor bescii TaxID=31899 RepID=B9MLZ6_CALBD|nr:FliA/WhiG family RNA polymerase sigma factor [Caldicellulosiruptor bescii]ACM61219.1 RNA polymerase, sigma 28 subunit, FliA/WhiG [Caldicellulosiruptor bescii DSM 6725]PBC88968.1 RNA polymerase sigma factor for flagellar operon FliA [Caldicellulosiruptor bescii]PBC91550.1 RNA polymerase sigma factor for flagellar operon FliA [Caldicellulosiruptor bescii]PBD03037.1 RNA polymerase sigma factor for flagellar operon FliA [Caldicellulosiruptor bescii]PBD07348.1 RNA polymerase sigma factor for fla